MGDCFLQGVAQRFHKCSSVAHRARHCPLRLCKSVVPSRGAAAPWGALYNTQGCRELIRFLILYHWKDIFKMSSKLNPNCYGLATRCRKLYFCFVECCKPKKVGTTDVNNVILPHALQYADGLFTIKNYCWWIQTDWLKRSTGSWHLILIFFNTLQGQPNITWRSCNLSALVTNLFQNSFWWVTVPTSTFSSVLVELSWSHVWLELNVDCRRKCHN